MHARSKLSTAVAAVALVVAAWVPADAQKRIAIPRPIVKDTSPGGGVGPRAIRPLGPTRSGDGGATETGSAVGNPFFSSPHAKPIALSNDGSRVYVANTPADTVDVVDTATGDVVKRIHVGIDPVSIAVRPDGNEVWVANHVSDTVSVIDSNASSATYDHVVATVQALDAATRSTRFDEPVGIAFANDAKAYVALSSENRIAIVDVASRSVTGHLEIGAQDPRAITVQGDRLYVIPFESGNQTELAGCLGEDNIDGDQCTFDILTHVVINNNVLSLGYDADIVRDPRVPDRDLYVFDTATDEVTDIVWSIGTLLYDIVVDSQGQVFIAQTEARNDANGRAGTLKHELVDLENRAFLNQIGTVDCSDGCGMPVAVDLDPALPAQPAPGMALATPFGIAISGDDSTLVVTAAGSAKVFTVDAATGRVLGRTDVGWVPRGVALQSSDRGAPQTAWILNAVANTVSEVDVSDRAQPRVTRTISLEDPTHPDVKFGRFAFNNADQSSSGTFSCESCHPDGHTDQLLWVLGGPKCDLPGCNQIPPRSTMPIRGLRDTAPYHWDGVPGDPFGGRNGQDPFGDFPPNCTTPESCTRHLLDGALASTMCDQNDCPTNEEGKPGLLTKKERDAMAIFLLGVPHVPGRERPIDDRITPMARQGFDNFFVNENRSTCGTFACHKMPFWTGTNIGGLNGMDAPSFRGIPDRWLILPQGRTNIFELVDPLSSAATNEVPWDYDKGFDELSMWALTFGTEENPALNRNSGGYGPLEVWQMFLEGNMGTPGAYGRQVTLNEESAGSDLTAMLLEALEQAASDGAILLFAEGVRLGDGGPEALELTYENGAYGSYSREQLVEEAAAGGLVVTLTGRIGPNVTVDEPQPELWSGGDPQRGGKHVLSYLPADNPMRLFGRHIMPGSAVFVNGRRVRGSVRCQGFSRLPNCADEAIVLQIDEADLPRENGLQLVQVQTPGGLQSNEFMFFTDWTE